jgi:uncharacterized membrane-anchored protein
MKTIAARFGLAVGLIALTVSYGSAQTAEEWTQIKKLNWQFAGSQGNIGTEAVLQVPKGFAFLGSADASRFIELQGNPPMANHFILAPMNLEWFSAFVFEPIGYVKDEEKIDPDELLETLKKSNLEDQQQRRQKGLQVLVLEGWFIPPHYDVQTKRLEWGTKLRTENNGLIVNYTIKLLGRKGVMDAIVVSDPENLDRDVNEFKSVLSSYSFTSGERYTEFRSGDKVAEYGLAALIIGGAAAAAAKSGALKGLMKFIWVGAIAIGAACWSYVKRLFRKA